MPLALTVNTLTGEGFFPLHLRIHYSRHGFSVALSGTLPRLMHTMKFVVWLTQFLDDSLHKLLSVVIAVWKYFLPPNRLTRFLHEPIPGERIALYRICLAFCLLMDQLVQYLPHFADFFGPKGVAPAGLHDESSLYAWYWTVAFFRSDNLPMLYGFFFVWVAATVALLVGWKSRTMSVIVWFFAMCFMHRNTKILIGADALLQVALFLLMLSPSGAALSLDARRRRRKGYLIGPSYIPPWSVRLIQLQLCMLYFTTGLIKLKGYSWSWELIFQGRAAEAIQGPWWDGTAIHYVLNYLDMSRFPYAQLPLPFWLTATMTYASVWWEVLFLPMMFWRPTRVLALVFGLLFHIGIFLTIEIGWFSFYSMCFYAVWAPARWFHKRE